MPNLNNISFDTDGDGNVNPGEEIIVDIEISNFSDDIVAYNIFGTLTSEDNIEIINPEIIFSDILFSDDSITNSYVININSDINLGEIELNLDLTADYIENNQTLNYNNETQFSIDVTLNQTTFPFYTSSQVATSPLVLDLDQNGEYEIIFADFTGKIFALNSDGEEDISYRRGKVAWLKDAWIEAMLGAYVERANIEANWNFVLDDKEKVQFATYKKQDFYDYHRSEYFLYFSITFYRIK